MEARRAFQGEAKSYKQIWIVVAALLAALLLGVVAPYIFKSVSTGAAPSGHVVQTGFQAPDAQDRNAQTMGARARATQLPEVERTHGR